MFLRQVFNDGTRFGRRKQIKKGEREETEGEGAGHTSGPWLLVHVS